MSIKAINWAWDAPLPPTPKLVLMKLSDAADDNDFCFPSIPHVAAKSSVSERTVQRILQDLTREGYMSSAAVSRGWIADQQRIPPPGGVVPPRQIVTGPCHP